MTEEFNKRFFENRDETGRFVVTSSKTGVTYYIEPIGDGRGGDWGSYNPATGNVENKKGFDKYTGSIKLSESMITNEAGFSNIKHLEVGESPMGEIMDRDQKYEEQGYRVMKLVTNLVV